MFLLRCVKLKRRRYSTLNSTLYWTSVPIVIHSLSWATLMLSLALKGLAMKYVLAPMVLLPEMITALFSEFCKIQKAENCGFLISETTAAPLDLI